MQLLLTAIAHPVEFGIAAAIAGVMIFIVFRAAISVESRQAGWVKSITSSNARIFFGILFVAWALCFGIGLQLVPHSGASSPYGGLALIALFTGFFIMMGFLWSVIGE